MGLGIPHSLDWSHMGKAKPMWVIPRDLPSEWGGGGGAPWRCNWPRPTGDPTKFARFQQLGKRKHRKENKGRQILSEMQSHISIYPSLDATGWIVLQICDSFQQISIYSKTCVYIPPCLVRPLYIWKLFCNDCTEKSSPRCGIFWVIFEFSSIREEKKSQEP